MRIAILGGTGQIGSVITDSFLNAFPKAEVLSCSRKGGDLKHQKKFNVNKDSWEELGKLDVIINSVGIIEEKGENTFEKAHINVVKDLIKNRELLGNPKIIHVSVLGADVNSPSKYASTKGIADNLLMEQEDWVIFRPSFVCTPGTAIVQKVLMLKKMAKIGLGFLPIPNHFLTPKFQPVMGTDIAEAMVCSINNNVKNEVVYATGPEIYQLGDWIDLAGKGKIKMIKIPKALIDIPFRILITIFPFIMNMDQYLLLANDNIHNYDKLQAILKKEPASTKLFWETSFK